MDEEITASVPIHSKGTAIGLSQGGLLDQQMHEIEVRCTPRTLPESIEVDISDLELDSAITVSELTFPENVVPISDGNQNVFQVALPRIEEEPEEDEGEGEEEVAVGDGDAEETENAEESKDAQS